MTITNTEPCVRDGKGLLGNGELSIKVSSRGIYTVNGKLENMPDFISTTCCMEYANGINEIFQWFSLFNYSLSNPIPDGVYSNILSARDEDGESYQLRIALININGENIKLSNGQLLNIDDKLVQVIFPDQNNKLPMDTDFVPNNSSGEDLLTDNPNWFYEN